MRLDSRGDCRKEGNHSDYLLARPLARESHSKCNLEMNRLPLGYVSPIQEAAIMSLTSAAVRTTELLKLKVSILLVSDRAS